MSTVGKRNRPMHILGLIGKYTIWNPKILNPLQDPEGNRGMGMFISCYEREASWPGSWYGHADIFPKIMMQIKLYELPARII
jgi:hypothetical protein